MCWLVSIGFELLLQVSDGDPCHVQLMLDLPNVGVTEGVTTTVAAQLSSSFVNCAAKGEGLAHTL